MGKWEKKNRTASLPVMYRRMWLCAEDWRRSKGRSADEGGHPYQSYRIARDRRRKHNDMTTSMTSFVKLRLHGREHEVGR